MQDSFPFLAKEVTQGGLERHFRGLPASGAGAEALGAPALPGDVSLEQGAFPEAPADSLPCVGHVLLPEQSLVTRT